VQRRDAGAGRISHQASSRERGRDDETLGNDGDTFAISVTGAFDAGAKTASGTGTWTHTSGSAVFSGTFTLTRTVAFQFYGCGVFPDGSAAPSTFCGGRVLLKAHFTEATSGFQFNGLIEVNCQVHGADFLAATRNGRRRQGQLLNEAVARFEVSVVVLAPLSTSLGDAFDDRVVLDRGHVQRY